MNNPNQFQNDPEMARWYRIWITHTVHPDLDINYFETIDTKEKAYWLGFLYADGYLVEHPNRAEIRLKLKLRDEETVDKFCDALQLSKDRKEYIFDEGGHKHVLIRFCCRNTSNDLIRHGLKFRKSKIIEYPELHQPEQELAFLLGYYDGDGRRLTTVISSGSIHFLEQVKEKYKLPYKIYTDRRKKKIYGRKLNSINYMLHLGPELFNKMMSNHTNSMPRKRWSPCDREESLRRMREANRLEEVQRRNESQREWKAITKEELSKLVHEMPLEKIAAKYNVSKRGTVGRKCRKLGIPIPERGYWTKIFWERVNALERNKKED